MWFQGSEFYIAYLVNVSLKLTRKASLNFKTFYITIRNNFAQTACDILNTAHGSEATTEHCHNSHPPSQKLCMITHDLTKMIKKNEQETATPGQHTTCTLEKDIQDE